MLITLTTGDNIIALANEISQAAAGDVPGVIYMKKDDYFIQISADYHEIIQASGTGSIIKISIEKVKN